MPRPMKMYTHRIITAAGITMNEFTRNLSLNRQPCVDVATMVVSEINDRLSPNSEPPTTTAVIRATDVPVCVATPAAMGVSATMVPTLVPTLSDMKHAARNSPASSISPGNSVNARLTVASIDPITFAECAKAPAKMNIHIISIICDVPAPLLYMSIRLRRGSPPLMITAYIDATKNPTVIGTL